VRVTSPNDDVTQVPVRTCVVPGSGTGRSGLPATCSPTVTLLQKRRGRPNVIVEVFAYVSCLFKITSICLIGIVFCVVIQVVYVIFLPPPPILLAAAALCFRVVRLFGCNRT